MFLIFWYLLISWCLLYSGEGKLHFKLTVSNQSDGFYINSSENTKQIVSEALDIFRTSQNTATNFKPSLWAVCRSTFIYRYEHVSVIDNENFLDPADTYNELGLVHWHTVDTFVTSPAVLIIVKSSQDLHDLILPQRSVLWSQKSIFTILVLDCIPTKVENELWLLWKIYQIYKYVFICGKIEPHFYNFRPFQPPDRENMLRVYELAEIQHNIIHAMDNLYGTEIRIVFFPIVPWAMFQNGEYLGGIDYSVLKELQQSMNFTPVIFRPSDGKTFITVGEKLSGSVRDIVLGKADIALNGHFLLDYKIEEIMLTSSINMDKMCFIVQMPTLKSHYTIIMDIFSSAVWGLIIVIYFMTAFLYYIIQQTIISENRKYNIKDLFFLFYHLTVFGAARIKTELISKKILVGSVLITIMILSNTFQGSLVTVLSRPMRNPSIDTLEEVMKSDLSLQSQRAESFFVDNETAQLFNILRQRKFTGRNFIRLGRLPLTKVRFYRNYISYKKNRTEQLHTVPDCIMSYSLAYVVPKKSPFLDRINTLLLKYYSSGLPVNWLGYKTDYLMYNVYRPMENENFIQAEEKAFTVSDLAFGFTLLYLGLGVSTIAFLVEKIIMKAKIKNKPKQRPLYDFVL